MKAFLTIIAAPGSFQKVVQQIRDLSLGTNAQMGYCHDVMGFCDIIVEMYFDGAIEDFFNQVINDVSKIPEVNGISSYAVYNLFNNKPTEKPITGYIFIGVIPSHISVVQNKLFEFDEIISTNVIMGGYEIVAVTTCPPEKFSTFTAAIQSIGGIKWSRSCIPHDVFRAFT